MSDNQLDAAPLTVGRYLLHREIARGGMATIHIARLMGDVGFSRIVAAKRLHPELATDDEFVAMFLDEARIASRVQHRNVVPVLDVVTMGAEVVLVQEYVHGAPLSALLRSAAVASAPIPIPVAVSIASQVLAGLHAAHETVDERGAPLGIVHRDVSPQNVMVAVDGNARLLDFGVAKVAMSAHVTRAGTFKGKLPYASPEQIRGAATRQTDVYALSVVLWELLVGRRLRTTAQGEAELVAEILTTTPPTVTEALAEERAWLGSYRWSQLEQLEPVIRKGLASDARRRWATAAEMEEALVSAVTPASASDVAAWLKAVGKDFLDGRDRVIAAEEASWRRTSGALGRTPTPLDLPTVAATEPERVRPGNVLQRRGAAAATALCSALVLALGFGIAFLVRDLNASTIAPAAALPTLSPQPSPGVTPIEATVARPLPVSTSELDTTSPEPQPAPRPITHAPSAGRSRVLRVVRPAPHPAAASAAPAAPPPAVKAAISCNPPYYFEGPKKLFKPSCI